MLFISPFFPSSSLHTARAPSSLSFSTSLLSFLPSSCHHFLQAAPIPSFHPVASKNNEIPPSPRSTAIWLGQQTVTDMRNNVKGRKLISPAVEAPYLVSCCEHRLRSPPADMSRRLIGYLDTSSSLIGYRAGQVTTGLPLGVAVCQLCHRQTIC